ncbi:MAG: ABC transporter permease [Acetobacteraceae bacterium]|nr:ABC transporter permease [Acetobacteraceae bacterium]
MKAYVLRRLVSLLLVLLGMTVVTFVISHVIPADPARAAAGMFASAEAVEAIRQEMGLDRPLYVQYWNYMRSLLHGDLGRSILTREPVLDDLLRRLPASLELAVAGMCISLPLGLLIGVVCSQRPGGLTDVLARGVAVLGVATPAFWLAQIMQLVFYSVLGWFPAAGRIATGCAPPPAVTGLYVVDAALTGNLAALGSALRHLILPAVTVGLGSAAVIARMTRSSMMEVLKQEFVRTARAKGLAERVVVYRHALRNALIPVITVAGMQFSGLIAWLVLVEVIFAWPGLGSYAARSVLALDFPAIMGFTLLTSTIYVVVNLAVDLVYAFIDPRIRY